jgi:hypothetical protein
MPPFVRFCSDKFRSEKNFKSSRKAYSDTASLDVSKAKSTVVVCPFFCKKSRVHLSKKLKPLRKAYATPSQNVVL